MQNKHGVAEDGTVFLSCRVPKEMKDALGEIAETEFTTLSTVVRQGIASHVSQRLPQFSGARE